MMRHTIDRARHVVPKHHLLTIINENHFAYAEPDLRDQPPENIIMQPCLRETGPGILLPLLHVYERDPEAVVCLFPSDHFIWEEARFMQHVQTAYDFAAANRDLIVLLGIQPDRCESGYGWIETGHQLFNAPGKSIRRVQCFWEKPDDETTELFYNKGYLWNTLTLIGSVKKFLDLFRCYAPELFDPFLEIWQVLGSRHEQDIVRSIYTMLPSVNFSQSILERSAQHQSVITVQNVYWSDWGDQSRVIHDLQRFGYLERLPRHLQLPQSISLVAQPRQIVST